MRYIGIWALAAVSIAVAAILFATQVGLPGGAANASDVLVPVADAFVEERRPDNNFGTRGAIRTDNSPIQETYLRFDVQNAKSPATLRIFS